MKGRFLIICTTPLNTLHKTIQLNASLCYSYITELRLHHTDEELNSFAAQADQEMPISSLLYGTTLALAELSVSKYSIRFIRY